MDTIFDLESISRKGDSYFARFQKETTREVSVTLPVYTGGVDARGRLLVSQTLRSVHTANRKRTEDGLIPLTKEEAMEMRDMLVTYDMVGGFENLAAEDSDKSRWIIRVKRI
jgi:hypothetical protein